MENSNSTIVTPPGTVLPARRGLSFRPPTATGEVGRLAHYRVLQQLGAGGMGAVYLAVDEHLDRRVALKVMQPDYALDPEARERFLREARTAASVKHDNVVTIYQVGEDDGVPYLAMELLAGASLAAYLQRKGRLTGAQALRVGAEAAAGLHAAHALGLVHRDVKPGNIWLEAPRGRVKILDFGLAKSCAATTDALTGTGLVLGTPGFMSPEQARGKPLDARSDLFSLGTVLYLLVTGRMPFDGDTTMAVLTALAVDEPAPVRELNPDVPDEFEAEIHRLLAKHPSDRPASGAEVAGRLQQIEAALTLAASRPHVVYVPVQAPVSPPAETPTADAFAALESEPTERTKSLPHRAPRAFPMWGLAAGAAAFALAVLVVCVVALRGPRAEKHPDPPAAKADPPPKPAARPAAPAVEKSDPDRKLAAWVLGRGGEVVTADGQTFRGGDELPPRKFKVQSARTPFYSNVPVTAADLELFRGADDLRTVFLGPTEVDDAAFERWSKFPNASGLTRLGLVCPRLGPTGLASIGRFRDLQELTIVDAAITDASLSALADLPHLFHLGLPVCRVTDAGVPALASLSTVVSLDLNGTAITDTGLKALAAKENLQALKLQGCLGITDAGLKHCHGRAFASLDVRRTGVTSAGVAALRAASPSARLIVSDP